jgi:outer membrane protein TolC
LSCEAAAASAETWTLERVLDGVRRSDPVIRSARASGEAARAQAAGGRAAFSPRVSLQAGITRSDDPALLFSQKLWQGRFTADDFALPSLNQPATATGMQWSLVVEQPLWNAGSEISAPGLAARRRRAADAAERGAIAGRLLEAVERYADAVSASAAEAADSVALAAAEGYRSAAVERLRMGQVSPLDSMRGAARAGEARLRWLSAQQTTRLALARLGALLGTPVDPASLASLPDVPGPPAVASTAPQPELVAAREFAAALATESRRAALGLLPSLNSRLTMTGYRGPDVASWERRWTAAVALDMPLWDGAHRFQEWRAARARAGQAGADAEALARDLAVGLSAAQANAALALERRAVARETAAAAVEALRFASARYRAGLLPLTDLLATDAEAVRARETQVAAEADAVVRHYHLLWARGELQ